MKTVKNPWLIWCPDLFGLEKSFIYGVSENNSSYLSSSIVSFSLGEPIEVTTMSGDVITLFEAPRKLKATATTFRHIQNGIMPEEAIQLGKSSTPIEAQNKLK